MLRACVNEYLQKLDLSNCGLHALPDDICHLSLLEVFQHTHSITLTLTHPLKYTHAHAHHSSCARTHQCVYHMYRYASDCKLIYLHTRYCICIALLLLVCVRVRVCVRVCIMYVFICHVICVYTQNKKKPQTHSKICCAVGRTLWSI